MLEPICLTAPPNQTREINEAMELYSRVAEEEQMKAEKRKSLFYRLGEAVGALFKTRR
ncbi:MAG: hypothetical protein HOH05_00385 [Marinovum sp.]|nr:hypothetical protein [Marinovum sp.]